MPNKREPGTLPEHTETGVSGGPMNTISGILLDPATVRPEDIRLYDIAHPLSLLCRGVGQVRHFLSIGQHCVNCAKEAQARGHSDRVVLACLLHDGAEAYTSDVIRPVKVLLSDFDVLEDTFQNAIYAHFGLGDLSEEELAQVKAIDDDMLWNEANELFSHTEDLDPPLLASEPNLGVRAFEEVEEEYIALAERLLGRLR